MLPFSYQGFGFTAILLMVAILSVAEAVKYFRARLHRHPVKAESPDLLKNK
jgi:hypothetical protein